jgi:putative ATP-binding cassette transporter
MNIFTYLFKQSRLLFLLTTLAGIVNGLSGAALAVVISKGVAGSSEMKLLGGLFFLLCLVQLATKTWSEISMLRLTQGAIYKMRVTISGKLLKTPYKKLQDIGKSGLLVILTRDIDTFVEGLQSFPIAFGNLVILVSCLGYVGWISWKLFIIFAITFAVCMAGFSYAERWPLKNLVIIREKMEYVYKNFRNLVDGTKELQLNEKRGTMFIEEVITPGAFDVRTAYIRGISGYFLVLNVGNVLFYFVIGVLLFLIPLWFPQRLEVLASVTLILLYLVRPVSDLMQVLPTVRQGMIALDRINQLDNDLDSAQMLLENKVGLGKSDSLRIELQGVEHLYSVSNEDQFLFGPINLTVNQGEILFIIGGNGSGKTTLAMLILGFYEPDKGAVLLNGTRIDSRNIGEYRNHFSAVFADFHLFEQLLSDDKSGLTEQATYYINMLGMGQKVKVVDGKFSTTDLSTGQRKRLALVVAYLEDKPVYLFDEWASDQDPVFKKVFYTELLPDLKRRGKTVIIITHDDAYFQCADRIVKLEDGHIKSMAESLA